MTILESSTREQREILSNTVKPLIYDITISTQVDDGEFTGEEIIT